MNLTFAGTAWVLPVALLAVVALAILLWGYWARGPLHLRVICGGLKFLGIGILALCLLEPLRSGQRARPGANLFAVMADNSQGLQIKDAGATATRGDQLREMLLPRPDSWNAILAENFDVRRYQFDVRLQGVPDFAELEFDGRLTALGTSLRALGDRLKGRPLAGILLFTDGNATDLPSGLPDLTGLPPVYPVVIGSEDAVRDVSLAQVSVSQSAFEDQPVHIQGEVAAPGFAGRRLTAQLRDTSGKVVTEESLTPRGSTQQAPFHLRPVPEEPGVAFYELSVAAGAAPSGSVTATNAVDGSEEATLVNNRRVIAVDRARGPYRVLYVSGRPNWEFKFLNRAIQDDHQLRLTALIRIAKREPKFEFRGRAGETSNPLFRGFGNQAPEDVERYDRPVIIGIQPAGEPPQKAEFPQTAEELFAYHAVILDDVEAAFFTPDQAALLQRFVSDRGGGLLMLGGMECFREGGYHRTPIGDLLPVYLDAMEDVPATSVRFDLAREGWLHPWARVRDQESAERQRLESMPDFRVFNRVRGVKPGASVVGTARDEAGRDLPALVIQRFGAGRSGSLLIGDYWRWGMRDPAARADLDQSWRQMLRWLVTEAPAKVELTAQPVPGDAQGAMNLQVRVRDDRFQPLDNASVNLAVEAVQFGVTNAAATNVVRLRAEPSSTEPGLYEVAFLPRQPGGYRATAIVQNEVGAEHGRDDAGWSSDPAAEEFRSLLPNRALLEQIAARTGGQVVKAEDLDEFTRGLPLRRAPVMETWTYPAWHTAAVFALALACLVAEWGLRRWKGLP